MASPRQRATRSLAQWRWVEGRASALIWVHTQISSSSDPNGGYIDTTSTGRGGSKWVGSRWFPWFVVPPSAASCHHRMARGRIELRRNLGRLGEARRWVAHGTRRRLLASWRQDVPMRKVQCFYQGRLAQSSLVHTTHRARICCMRLRGKGCIFIHTVTRRGWGYLRSVVDSDA